MADVTGIPNELYENLYNVTLEPTRRPLTGSNQQMLSVEEGLKYNSKEVTDNVYFVWRLRCPYFWS